MDASEAERIVRQLARGYGRVLEVDGQSYRAAVNCVRTGLGSTLVGLSGAVGFWRERPSPRGRGVERTWVESSSVEGRRVMERLQAVEAREREAQREATAEPTVTLIDRVLDEIAERAFWDTGHDGKETGGCLFGTATASGATIRRATGPGTRAERGRYSLTIDPLMANAWEIGSENVELGTWHCHPVGSPEPSRQDRIAWRAAFARCRRETGAASYVGMILGRNEDGWTNPAMHAWLVTAGEPEPRIRKAKLRGGV